MSKAADKSNKTSKDVLPEHVAATRSLWILHKAVSVECSSLYADWYLVKIPASSMKVYSWSNIIRSIIFDRKVRLEIGR